TAKSNAVIALAASPWAPLVAVGGSKQVVLYHGDTFELVGIFPFPYGTPHVLKFSRNGGLLLAGGGRGGQSGKVVVWDVKSGDQIIEVGNEQDAVLAADISADQQLIALGGPNKMIRIYSTKDASLVREMKKHTDWIYAVEFSPDAVLLATADRSGGLFVWEAATGREFYNLRGHTGPILDVSWRDDSNVLASASEDTTVRLWEMENGTQIKSWGAHGGGTQAVKFSHDNRLVSTGRDRVTKVWDMNGAVQKQFPAHPDVALRAAFSHDNAKVYAGDWTGTLQAFNVADAKVLAQATTNPQDPVKALTAATQTLAAKQKAFDAANTAYTPAAQKVQQTAA
ncbi:MAG TPA: WD40 repeat domain-containing protein, partial [Acidimicrobiales bacterium]|nr:WD40 repeat domain-containing protein [Acidimicrobiales bacterium]